MREQVQTLHDQRVLPECVGHGVMCVRGEEGAGDWVGRQGKEGRGTGARDAVRGLLRNRPAPS